MVPCVKVLSTCVNRVVDGHELMGRMHLLLFYVFYLLKPLLFLFCPAKDFLEKLELTSYICYVEHFS